MKRMNEIILRRKKKKSFFRKIAAMISYINDLYERKKEEDYIDTISGKSSRVKTYGKI